MALITLKQLKMLIGGKDGRGVNQPQYNMGIGEALLDVDRQRNYGMEIGGKTLTIGGDKIGMVTGWLDGAIEYSKVATEVLTGFIGPPNALILSPNVEADEDYYNETDKMRALNKILDKSFKGVDLKPLLILRLSVFTEDEPDNYDDSDPDSPNAETVLHNTPRFRDEAPTLIYYNPPPISTIHHPLPETTIVANLYDYLGEDKKGEEDWLIHTKTLKTQKDYEDVFSLKVWPSGGYNADKRLHLKSFIFNGYLDDEKRDDVKVRENDTLVWTGNGANIEKIDADHTADGGGNASFVWLIWSDPSYGYDVTEYSPVANYCMGRIGRLITLLKHYDPTGCDPCIHCGSQEIARDSRYCIDCGKHPYSNDPPISAKEFEKEQEALRWK